MSKPAPNKLIPYTVIALLIGSFIVTVGYVASERSVTAVPLRTFSGMDELLGFIERGKLVQSQYSAFGLFQSRMTALEANIAAQTADAKTPAGQYSSTNVQVGGVDEADIVKTDGEYLYVVSGSTVKILKASPPEEAGVLATIETDAPYNLNIYINGDRLIVLENSNYYWIMEPAKADQAGDRMTVGLVPWYRQAVAVKVYDIADRANPALTNCIEVNGTLIGSRMIGNYVYVVSNQPVVQTDGTVEMPSIRCNETVQTVRAEEIKYVDVIAPYYQFMTVMAIDVTGTGQPTQETFLSGYSSTMYVSQENMYLVAPKSTIRLMGAASGADAWKEETLIYRLRLSGSSVKVESSGAVPGHVLNQFSMDESNGYFRVATSEWMVNGSVNGLYVLNMNLETVGRLEGIAPGEQIYSARFMGDRCYLVTFRQVDPFFVIDLATPSAPKILGYLKIPGYSSYLHPYDADHVIGVGIENSTVKLSLFDVSDVSSPEEVAKYVFGGMWSSSEALYDHKAFLFDKSKGLLVIPVTMGPRFYTGDYRAIQGAAVFDISADDGFVLRGFISHQGDGDGSGEYRYNLQVRRSLYIDDTLYTISEGKVKLNGLTSLDPVREIPL